MKTELSRRTFIASAAASLIPPAVISAQPASSELLSLFSTQPQTQSEANPTLKGAGVIDLSHSPYAKLKTVAVGAVGAPHRPQEQPRSLCTRSPISRFCIGLERAEVS